MTTPTKLLLDTDIGSDIDDAVCLAYLLANPACDLLGITTVTGDVVARARIADALCRRANRTIPIFPGLSKGLLLPVRQPEAPQAKALAGKWPHRTDFPSGQAIEFLRTTIRQNPGEVVLLGIGPMTNIAALFTVDPEIPRLLKSLVLMAGNFTPIRWPASDSRLGEWNVWNDPHAASLVYQAAVNTNRSLGLDVTSQVRMDARQVQQSFSHPLLELVADLAAVWFEHAKEMTFHDPLAAVSIFDPEVCHYTHGDVRIETISEPLEGFTDFKPNAQGRHEVATGVDPNRFFQSYFAPFVQPSPAART